jgi:thioredoxin-like negative regulator of GroEL
MALAISSQPTAQKVLTTKQPVLLLYKMNGCGHCMAFEPTWVQIAKQLSGNKSITVAEVEYGNMTNLLPSHLHVQGFPTIMIVNKGKKVSEYTGMRTKESVIDFASTFVASSKPKAKAKAPPKAKTKATVKAKAKSV